MTQDNESYIGKNRRKQHHRYKEDRDDLVRGLNDMRELLQQAVWLLAIIAIVVFVFLLGGVSLILLLG